MHFLGEVFWGGRRRLIRPSAQLALFSLLSLLMYAPISAANGANGAQEGNWLVLKFQKKKAKVGLISDGETIATQVLKPKARSDCRLDTDGSLLDFSGSQSVGFKKTIGIKGKSQGTPCGQVRNNEFLRLALGSDEGVLNQKVVEATLNLLIHRDVLIQIEARNGADLVQKYEVRAGHYTSEPVESDVIAFDCPSKRGNCKVSLEASDGLRWDSLKMITNAKKRGEAGAWSIGGGPSRFRLLDFTPEGDLDCGDAVVEGDVTLQRLDNVGQETCTQIPYQLEFDEETIAFIADYGVLDEGEDPAFAFDVEWRAELVEGPNPQAIPFEGVNPPLDNDSFVQQVPFSVQWFGPSPEPDDPANPPYFVDSCPGQPLYEDGVLVGLTAPLFNDNENGPNDMSDLPGFQFGCRVSRIVEIVPIYQCDVAGSPPLNPSADMICVRVRESLYVRGDWRSTRRL